MTSRITPCLWFDGNAEEAADFLITWIEGKFDPLIGAEPERNGRHGADHAGPAGQREIRGVRSGYKKWLLRFLFGSVWWRMATGAAWRSDWRWTAPGSPRWCSSTPWHSEQCFRKRTSPGER